MVKIRFNEDDFEVDMEGIEKFEALKGRLVVPYSHVSAVDEDATEIKTILRVGGTSLGFAAYEYGRFETSDGYGFYAFKKKSDAFAVHLSGERYKVLVLEVEDNSKAISELKSRTGM